MKWLAIVALATAATALPDMFMGRRRGGFLSHLHQDIEIDPDLLAMEVIGSETVTQKLDHFDDMNDNTWEQRYFFNHNYSTEDSAVNILYLSGEQVNSIFTVYGETVSYVYYAKELNADVYSLEHRFYGKSRPTKDTSVENLKYLSSRQAIEDIAEFIRQINKKKGGDQKWIIVGGSYAGALSAWSRLLHPELIFGSIASSGPVLAQMDFYGYFETVEADFKSVGGLCYDQISAGLDEAERLWQSEEGRQKLTDMFRITPPLSDYEELTDYDKDSFFGALLNEFAGAAQYSQPTINQLCRKFTRHGTDYDPLEAFVPIVLSIKYPTVDVNFTAGIEELSITDIPQLTTLDDDSMRLWIYQTCAEFGYFQTTNKGTNVFGQTQSSNTFIEYCVRLFGIDADQIQKNIDATNKYYGERDYYAGTNVIFSHGTQDPWSYLTKKDDAKHWSVVIVEVEGGDHCSDIGFSCFTTNCTDGPYGNMEQIQTLTLENMRRWIDPTFPVPDRVEITDNVGKRPQLYSPLVSSSLETTAPESKKIRADRSKETQENRGYSRWNKFTGKGRQTRLPPVSADIQNSDANPVRWIEQTWDHFNPNEERTFKQKYYSNYQYGTQEGPNFLMIGGEGPESPYWVQNEGEAWMTYAKAVGANVFDLEHRYYGESKLGTNDLQFLTSAQMLYDVATFIQTVKVKENKTGPWITFGGSYPGALAAWSREWFPELILGAVGSSGPVLAKNDFYEYLEVVEDVIRRQNQTCYDKIAEGFEGVRKLTQTPEGRGIIQSKFRLAPAWTADPNDTIDPLDMDDFFMALSGLFMGTVQYNSVDWSDVSYLCSIIENDDYDGVDALAALRYEPLPYGYGDGDLGTSFDEDMQYYIDMKGYVDGHDPKAYLDKDLASVLWIWQTCNEFGYYQTSDYGEGIFGTTVPLNYFIVMCERVFGVGMDHVENGIAKSKYQYGGRSRYDATNVVLPNGDADPWHALGILERGDLDESVVPILIKGTSHCADMNPTSKDDPPELTQARKTILENIQKWLAPPPSPSPTSTVSPTSSTSSKTSTSATQTIPTTSTSIRVTTETAASTPSTPSTTATVSVTTSSASSISFLLTLFIAAFLTMM